MTKTLTIDPVSHAIVASVRPPGSKSLTNRALVCAALARGDSTLTGALDSEDTRVMIQALGDLGIEVAASDDRTVLHVKGCAGKIPAASADLYIANSGTTVRFLTALVALGRGRFRLHGTPRMHERPIQDLLDALTEIGVEASSEPGTGCPPVVVRGRGLHLERATIRGDVSSQFASALLMAAACAEPAGGTAEIAIDGPLVSRPYVEMTVLCMRAFGANVQHNEQLSRFEIPRDGYVGREYAIEPDASAASYFWAAAAITGGQVRVEGLNRRSLQGDVAFVDALVQMGCQVESTDDAIAVTGNRLRGIEVDMNAISDTAQTLGVVALFAEGPTTIRGIGHIRHKETDRIAALATELRKLGASVEEQADGMRIVPGPLHAAQIATYDDHRMAMSFALAGLKVPGVTIEDPDCTAKTYPGFWDDLSALVGQ